MMVYKAKPSRSEGRQITFPDSIHFIVEAIHPGNDIFDETGEIPGVPGAHGGAAKKNRTVLPFIFYIYKYPSFPARPS